MRAKPSVTQAAPIATFAPDVPAPEAPPGPLPERELSFPEPVWNELSSGLKVATIVRPSEPLVEIRVVVFGGGALSGKKPGLALMTAHFLKEGGTKGVSGREVLSRIDAIGATLGVETTADNTTFSVTTPRDKVTEALDIAGSLVTSPAFNPVEYTSLKKRLAADAYDRARTDGRWVAEAMLYRSLFQGGSPAHPYSRIHPTEADLSALRSNDCRAFHKEVYVPKNIVVVVAGSVEPASVVVNVEKAFGKKPGADPPAATFPSPAALSGLSITLVDRPASPETVVLAGVLGPERASASWPAFAVANQILGGAETGRLVKELRGDAALATEARSDISELSRGSSLLTALVTAPKEKSGLAVKALLSQLERLTTSEPSALDVALAAGALSGKIVVRLDSTAALADDLTRLRALGLPDNTASLFRRSVREVTPKDVALVSSTYVTSTRTALVVAGDAKVVGTMLSRFGDVLVVDPTASFAEKETLSKDPDASLSPPNEAGK